MSGCESPRACRGRHVWCGSGREIICALCLKSPGELEEWAKRPIRHDEDACLGAMHGRHVYTDGECRGCGRQE